MKEDKIEDIKKQLELCSNCGLCKQNCPVFRVLLNESYSPRGKSILLKSEIIDEIFYSCSMCKSCEETCPAEVKLCDAIRQAREIIAEEGKAPEQSEEMIENIRRYGNPFGKFKKGEIPKDLHCC
jgi:Fe-S oxidoreductase